MPSAIFGFAVALAALSVSPARESANIDTPTSLLPGLGAHDPRHRLDSDKVPWNAVGKLQVASLNRRQSCTAALVSPSTVLTAAHCAFNFLTRRYFPPGELHFLIGYDGSRYVGHSVGLRLETGPGFDPNRPSKTRGSDWALILLANRLGSADRLLPMVAELPEIGSAVMLGGYQQDHPLVLMADTECRIVGRATDADGRLLLRHNCAGIRGDSGAPLLIEKGGKWYTAGVNVAAERGVAGGLAVVLDEAHKRL